MLSVVEVDACFFDGCVGRGLGFPVEQSGVWAGFSEVCGHGLWKRLLVRNGDVDVAVVALFEYDMRGFKYLWAKNGPVFLDEAFRSFEGDVCLALRDFVRSVDSSVVFLRLNVLGEFDFTRPVMRLIPYDTTVILDICGSDEDILSRMKPRGRRDVRKRLRETGMVCAEESATILGEFDRVYEIMCETAVRDGFVPHDIGFYRNMVECLGDNCKFFVGRIDGEIVCWSITTVFDGVGVQYFAATSALARRLKCYDQLVFFVACYLRDLGVGLFDLMAIGSDFSPSLLGLNEFKTKFAKDVVRVAPSRDVVCVSGKYLFLSWAFRLRGFVFGLLRR